MKNNRQKQKQATRQKILEAAYELFDEKGYDNTSYADIARRCKLGYGTIYSHFVSKENLLLEHYLELTYGLVQRLEQEKMGKRNPYEHARYLMDIVWESNVVLPIRNIEIFFSYRWVSSREDYDRVYTAINNILMLVGSYLTRAQKEKLLSSDIDLEQCFRLMRAAYLHALQQARFGDEARDNAKVEFDEQVAYLLEKN
jgi:AcrR family transcriptional regulator